MPRVTRDPLLSIPGVGPATAGDLHYLGVESVSDLKGRDPEDMYARMCAYQGPRLDRCVLYVFRCVVYYAEGGREPELLKWWNWKDTADPPLEALSVNA